MSKIFTAKHKAWNITRTGPTAKNAMEQIDMSAEPADFEITEIEKTDWILNQVPTAFRGILSYMAYERGHSAGADEVEAILEELVTDLLPAIQTFQSGVRIAHVIELTKQASPATLEA